MKYNLWGGKFLYYSSKFGLPYVIKNKLIERKTIYYLHNVRLLSISKQFERLGGVARGMGDFLFNVYVYIWRLNGWKTVL